MAAAATRVQEADPEHVDVLIVGAGLSGIGAACHLRRLHPQRSFAILEARERMGGTWDLFRYPGVRSDSDMFTLGYRFRPWQDAQAIAPGPAILDYIRETAREHGVEQQVRYGRRVVAADWSSERGRWTVTVEDADGQTQAMTCGFLYGCTGYYRYDEGYTPSFPGIERFAGQVVHPQHWPQELDWTGKRVVVIGSGATAVTLVPAMAERAEHVTMLQRSPTYVVSLPGRDGLAEALGRRLPARLAYGLVRAKNVLMMAGSYRLSRRAPGLMRRMIARGAAKHLPDGYDVARHFNPSYDPWDQRMCLVPDGDLFAALGAGSASIVTDTIDTFTEGGLRLSSGEELEADIVITATGLNLLALGGIELALDGRPVALADTVAYKGMMLSGVPNMAMTLGYTNASWTLKADLVAAYVCRLLSYMDEHDFDVCVPDEPADSLAREPFLNLQSGYVLRSLAELPKQGAERPWRLHTSYLRDIPLLRRGPVDDAMRFERARSRADRRPEELAGLAA
jgi:cation diffusion facilitator CzcD-associated flavoprotein CzcO